MNIYIALLKLVKYIRSRLWEKIIGSKQKQDVIDKSAKGYDSLFRKKSTLFKLSILDRYLFHQLIVFFLFSISLFAAVGVTIGTVSELTYKINEYNLPINIAILVFILKIPEYTAYALPIGTLLTTLLVYGRLNSDYELIAFRSIGISLYRIIFPAIAFSILITLITLFCNELVVPAANYQATLLQNPFLGETEFTLQRKDIFYPEYQENTANNKVLRRLYYAEKFDGKQLVNMTIMTWSGDKLSQIITAKNAQLDQTTKKWQLTEGQEEILSNDLTTTEVNKFDNKKISLPATFFKLVKIERSPEEMNIKQAIEYLNLIGETGSFKNIQLLKVRIQQKLAFPTICLVFSLVGSALGATYSTINKSQGFGVCVAIVFSYYLLGLVTGSLGIVGLISPFLAAWAPNFLGIGISGWLLITINN